MREADEGMTKLHGTVLWLFQMRRQLAVLFDVLPAAAAAVLLFGMVGDEQERWGLIRIEMFDQPFINTLGLAIALCSCSSILSQHLRKAIDDIAATKTAMKKTNQQ